MATFTLRVGSMKLVKMSNEDSSMNPVSPGAFLHEPFLERAADPTAAGNGDLSLGAFLTMRLVDQFRPGLIGSHPGALAYQAKATWDFLTGLTSDAPDLNYLREIVRIAESTLKSRNVPMLWPPMLAFAHWLEGELRLAEALDVLDTTTRLASGEPIEEQVAAGLHRGRVLRLAGRLQESRDAYTAAGKLASYMGDTHSELLSRIGRAIVFQRLGNLPEAERMLTAVIDESRQKGDKDAEARARHDRAHGYLLKGRVSDAVPELYIAFELYGQSQRRLRALSDLGIAFKSLSENQAAEDAFQIVLGSECPVEMRVNTMLELLEVAAARRDRMSFERWRREISEVGVSLPPDASVDLELKVGAGLGVFGNRRKAEEHLRKAIQLAEASHLNEYLFRAEEALRNLPKDRLDKPQPEATPGWIDSEPEIQHVAERLHALRAGA